MRSANVIASTWSWVTYTIVVSGMLSLRLAISNLVATLSAASKFDNGSSNRNTLGLRTIARPIATRWRCPPDNALGSRLR